MLIKSWVEPIDKTVCDESVPDQYRICSSVVQKEIVLEDPAIEKLVSRQTVTDGLFIIDTYMAFKTRVRDHFEISGESIILIFHIRGQANGNINDLIDDFGFTGNINNIFYTPGLDSKIDMHPFLQHNYFCVVMSRDFYFHILNKDLKLHRDFADNIINKVQTYLSHHSLNTTYQMKNVIHDIRNCQREGEFKRMYLEAKVLELLLLQFEQLQLKTENPSLNNILKKNEETKIHQAREILEADIQNPPNIKNLSKLVSLNEFKLKNGFKACYNTTIHQYLIRLRMMKAKELLNNKNYSIGEIATIVGYKNPAHFSKAFKNFYDRLPSESIGIS